MVDERATKDEKTINNERASIIEKTTVKERFIMPCKCGAFLILDFVRAERDYKILYPADGVVISYPCFQERVIVLYCEQYPKSYILGYQKIDN